MYQGLRAGVNKSSNQWRALQGCSDGWNQRVQRDENTCPGLCTGFYLNVNKKLNFDRKMIGFVRNTASVSILANGSLCMSSMCAARESFLTFVD